MKLITKTAIATALSAIALSASAMTPIQDADLSQVSGQDGVSIAADLHVNIGSFKYSDDATTTGGSVSFNGIKVGGTFAMTLDILKDTSFLQVGAGGAITGEANTALGLANTSQILDLAAAGFYAVNATGPLAGTGSDVVKIAIPNISVAAGHELNMSVDSIKMSNSTASFGAFALNDIKLQGTTVYIWAH